MLLRDVIKVSNRVFMFLYVLLYAINPIVFYYAFEGRMYALVGLLSTYSFYLFFKKKWSLYIIVAALGLYTHYYFVFVLLVQGIAILLFEKKKRFKDIKYPIISCVLFLPWLLYISSWFFGQTQSFWMQKLTVTQYLTLPGVLLTGYESSQYYHYYDSGIGIVTGLLVILFIFLIYRARKHLNPLFYTIVLWSFLGYLLVGTISLVKPIFVSRYLIFCTVGLMALLALLLERIPAKAKIICLTILFIITIHYTYYEVKYKTKGDIRSTIHQISYLSGKDDLLYLTDAGNYFVGIYYFPEKRVYVFQKKENIPSYVGISAIPNDKITQELPAFPKKAFVLKNDYDYEIESATY
jgi:uncharacterized membrane protein